MKQNVIGVNSAVRPLSIQAINTLGKGLRICGLRRDSFNIDFLMSKAIKRTGLDDFGPNSFREGLEILVDSLNREAKLNTIGYYTLRNMLLNSLVVRLKTQQWVKEHPEVTKERIEKPFIIVGLPRTGTTILSYLLEMNPENRSLVQWQAENPVPPPQLATMNEDPRIFSCARKLKMMEKILPNFHAIHPTGATIPTECIVLFNYEFKQPAFGMLADVPSYLEWVRNTDFMSAYNYHKLLLQVLQSCVPTQTWSLKAPVHTWMLETLVKGYPDARLIFAHRDLQKVIPSIASLMTTFRRCFRDYVNAYDIGSEIMLRLSRGVEKAMNFENNFDRNDIFHVQYNELMNDPIKTVQNIYTHFGQEVRPLHKRNMNAWLKFYPQNKYGKHSYALADFGLNANEIKKQFGEYISRYNVPFASNC